MSGALDLTALALAALERRRDLLAALHAEGTDCYRILHGIAEGAPGTTLDRYGPLLLLQTFRAAVAANAVEALGKAVSGALGLPLDIAHNHRGEPAPRGFVWHRATRPAQAEHTCHEAGLAFLIRARHRGQDPWLFLDLRPGRRRLRSLAQGRSVLNLFAYTCTAGVAALASGASEVWNVDFAASALAVGARNAARNGVAGAGFSALQSDCIPVLRQLAGLPVARWGKGGPYPRIARRTFDLVFLDPPRWAKGAFGAVDVVRDYPSLLKPCLLALASDGIVIATNHVPEVAAQAWISGLRRCAEKAGRPLRGVELLGPDADFPAFDDRPPLKIAVCQA